MDSTQEMNRLKAEIKALQEQLNELMGSNKVVDEYRLRRIGFINAHSCAQHILCLARVAVDNKGRVEQSKGGVKCTKPQKYQDMNARQRELVRQVANEIIEAMEKAYNQHPWDENTEDENGTVDFVQ